MSDFKIHESTAAVIEWQWGDATRFLIEPDPKYGNITFTTRFDTTRSFFGLSMPIKIKHTRLKDNKDGGNGVSALHLRIHAAAVNSLCFSSTTTAPDAIQKRLASCVTRLDFQLDQNFDILVPKDANEPLIPARRQSREVLDAIRQISNKTSLSIYIQHAMLSGKQVQLISDACREASHKSFRSDDYDLSSLYGGRGAKVVRLSAETGQLSRLYNGIESPAPSAHVRPLKRPRQDSDAERGDITTELQSMLGKMEQRILAKVEERLKGLDTENQASREDLQGRIEGLETEIKRQREYMEKRIKSLEEQNQRLKEDTGKLPALLEYQSDDIDRVGEQS